MEKRKLGILLACVGLALILCLVYAGRDQQQAPVPAADAETVEAADAVAPDYGLPESWAYYALGEDKAADLFLICPTVDMRDEYNMRMDDEKTRASFLGALNMERGIYEESTRMFAPYYRQAAMKVYSLTPEEWEPYMERAYRDVSAAFAWYLEHENAGRPIEKLCAMPFWNLSRKSRVIPPSSSDILKPILFCSEVL